MVEKECGGQQVHPLSAKQNIIPAITNRYLDGFPFLITISPMGCTVPIVQRKCELSLPEIINSAEYQSYPNTEPGLQKRAID